MLGALVNVDGFDGLDGRPFETTAKNKTSM
jgi:hypothetical protein